MSLDTSENSVDTLEKMKKIMGKPRNYGLTVAEKEAIQRREEEEKLKRDAAERAEKDRRDSEERTERKRRQEEWVCLPKK